MKNYYQILGLESNATKEDIKKAFRLYAQHYHPDKQDGNKFFEQRFIEIKNAYDILVDDNKRFAYDLSQKDFSRQNSKNKSFFDEKEEKLKSKEEELRNREAKLKKEELDRIKRETELRKKEEAIRQKENQIRYEQEIENKKNDWKKEQERLWAEKNKKNAVLENTKINEEKKEETSFTENNSGCLTYKIDGFYYSKTLGTEYAKNTANGIYLAVKLIIASNTKKTESTEDLIFKLTGNDNCEFETSIEGTSAIWMSGITTFGVFAKYCHPSVPVEGYVIFDVPTKSEYSIVIKYYTLSLTMKLLPNLELIQSNEEKQKEIKSEEINQKINHKVGLLEFEKGTSKFNCGICKGEFYANRIVDNIVSCPHCKKTNSLPKLEEAYIKPLTGAIKFYCGVCKKRFYSNRSINDKVICPNCKSINTLTAVKYINNIHLPKILKIAGRVAVVLLIFVFLLFIFLFWQGH